MSWRGIRAVLFLPHVTERCAFGCVKGFFLDNMTSKVDVKLLLYNPELDAIADIIVTFSVRLR